jgi:Domain of unknown function (DUF4340)
MNRLWVLVGITVVAGCSPVDAVKPYRELAARRSAEATTTWPMVPVGLDDVYRVIASGGGKEVEVQRTGGGLWEPGKGAAPVAGTLMSAAQAHLIPMPAYRRLDVDPAADPGFGFAGSDVALTVETQTAQRITIRFGGPNPTGGGFYARRDDDPHVYVVVDQVVDEVRSLLAGTEIVRPEDPRVAKVLADDARNEDPEEVTNPWLGQVIDGSH